MRTTLAISGALLCFAHGCGDTTTDPDASARPDASTDAAVGATDDAASGTVTDLSGLPNDTWSFVPVEGAVCGNGTPLSIGVNPRADAEEVLVVVMGGGACWNAETCFTLASASHVTEDYTRAMFEMERMLVTASGWDDRASAANPFRESHIVFVPYCSGDLHAGDAVQSYEGAPSGAQIHHRGGPNTQRIVDAMSSAWPELARVRVVGFSAGGYGAQLNWGRYADAWPDADLAILADSAPLLQPSTAQYDAWRTSWNMVTPSGCTDCATRFSAYDDHFDATYPSSRLALMATTRDSVIEAFWGMEIAPLYGPLLTTLDDNDTTRYFVVDSSDHVILGQAGTLRSADGVLLIDWLVGWLTNNPATFQNHAP